MAKGNFKPRISKRKAYTKPKVDKRTKAYRKQKENMSSRAERLLKLRKQQLRNKEISAKIKDFNRKSKAEVWKSKAKTRLERQKLAQKAALTGQAIGGTSSNVNDLIGGGVVNTVTGRDDNQSTNNKLKDLYDSLG
jgi:small-conductance mechanosensitive channel